MTISDDELRRRLRALADHAATTPTRSVAPERKRPRAAVIASIAVAVAAVVVVIAVTAQNGNAPRTSRVTSRPSPSVPAPADLKVMDATFLDATHAWVVLGTCDMSACNTTVDASTDAGRSFHRVGTGPRVTSSHHLTFATVADGFVAGPNLSATHDGGRTWASTSVTGDVVDIAAAGRSVWVETKSGLFGSADGGITWGRLPTQPPVSGALVHAAANTGIVEGPADPAQQTATPAVLATTSDGGRTWQQVAAPCSGNAIPNQPAFLAQPPGDSTLWLACAGQPSAGSQGHAVYRSTAGGRTWTPVGVCQFYLSGCSGGIGATGYLQGAVAMTADRAYLLFARGPMLGTSDAGLSWTPLSPVNGCDDAFGAGGALDGVHGWALSAGTEGCAGIGLWTTADGGTTWTQIWAPSPPTGTMSGRLVAVGGPLPGGPRPLAGTISLYGPAGTTTLTTGTDGRFSATVPAGTYAVIGRSPSYQSGAMDCKGPSQVVVTAGATVTATVECQER